MRCSCPAVGAVLATLVFCVGVEAASPAERRIEAAETDAARRPGDAEPLRALAVALGDRARETANPALFAQARAAIVKARTLHGERADSPALDVVEAWIELGRHRFSRAERLARRAVASAPSDPEAHGVLGDALMELQRFSEARHAYERMLSLRPGPASYVRGAHYREAIGDFEGALDLLDAALIATPWSQPEQRAWMLVHAAFAESQLGRPSRASRRIAEALRAFPGYPLALEACARLATPRGTTKCSSPH